MIRRVPLTRLALVLLLAAGAVWMLTHRDMLKLESIEPALRALGIWAPIGFIVIYAAAHGAVLFRRDAQPGRRCSVRSGLGHRVEPGRRHARRHGRLSAGPHRRRRVGGAACWRTVATPG